MYMNFWYPMATSEELGDKPLKVRALGQDFVVFRDGDGKAACLANICVHRGGSLAGGKTREGCIECPYHGWRFDAAGQCRRIPSLGPDARIPARARVDAYPVQERYGIVFAFLGDLPEEQRPPLLEVKEWDQEGWRPLLVIYEATGNYERSMENGLDPAHNEFVHDTHGFQGENEAYRIGDMRIEESLPWGRGFWHTFNSPKLPEGEMRKLRDFEGDLEAGTGHLGANQLWTYIHVTDENWFHQYAWERPVDENFTIIYGITMRNCALEPEKDDYIAERNNYVAGQDMVIINDLRPVLTPDSANKEYMVPADKVIQMYREMLADWDAKGWRIDRETVLANERKVAYAIPCPARREHKGWVLDPVPVLERKAAAARAAG